MSEQVQKILVRLAQLEGDRTEYGRAQRINLNNAMCEFLYGLSDVLKDAGKPAEADQAHSLANKHWSKVIEETNSST
jgi:hypothetical protein